MLPYRRHQNGSGKVYGNLADVSRDTFLDRDSSVEGDSTLHASRLMSTAIHTCKLHHAIIQDCAITDSTICGSEIVTAQVQESVISDAYIRECKLHDVSIRGFDGSIPKLQNVALRRVKVDGDVELVGPWTLDAGLQGGDFYIREGRWERPPQHLILESDDGIHVGLTEGVSGAFVACEHRSVEDWLKDGVRIGMRLGWSRELAMQAYRFMEELADVKIERAA